MLIKTCVTLIEIVSIQVRSGAIVANRSAFGDNDGESDGGAAGEGSARDDICSDGLPSVSSIASDDLPSVRSSGSTEGQHATAHPAAIRC